MNQKLADNEDLNAMIVLFSYHHKNTEKVAEVIAKVLDATNNDAAANKP